MKNRLLPHGADHLDNIICLPGQPGDVFPPVQSSAGMGVVLMYVTWSDLIAFVAMITGIIALTIKIHKK